MNIDSLVSVAEKTTNSRAYNKIERMGYHGAAGFTLSEGIQFIRRGSYGWAIASVATAAILEGFQYYFEKDRYDKHLKQLDDANEAIDKTSKVSDLQDIVS